MSGDPYEIVRYTPQLAAGTAALRALLTPTNNPVEAAQVLDWKYRNNPYLPEPLIYLALFEGRPVAMRGFFGSLWEIAGARRIVPCAGDLIVAPEHRDKGLIARIMQFAEADLTVRGFTHIFSMSGGPVTTMNALTQKFRRVASIDERVLGDPQTTDQSWGAGDRPFVPFDVMMRKKRLLQRLTYSEAPHPLAMAALIRRLPRSGGLRHVRDPRYLAWRYRNPIVDFRFLYSGRAWLDGYLVLAAQRDAPDLPVYVLDWEGTSRAVKQRLLETAIATGRFKRLSIWSFGYGAEDRDTIVRCGFAAEKQEGVLGQLGLSVLVKPLAPADGADPTLNPASWDFRMLYSDYC